jgi:hypothetical protein
MARSPRGEYPRGVTHADLRQRLEAYADGTLDDAEAEVVRIHLATGCPECLRDVFTRPVGLPRPVVVVRRPIRAMLVAGLGGAAAVGVMVGVLLGLRDRPHEPPTDPRLDALASEVERLRAERDRAEAAARRQSEEIAARASAAPGPTSSIPPPDVGRADAATANCPPPAADDPEPAAVPGWFAADLAAEGARVVPLGPGEGTSTGTGFAVWSAARRMVVVSASNLPLGAAEALYRVRVTMVDGSTAWVGDVVASSRRDLVIAVTLPDTAGRVDRVDLYRDPPGAPVLTARLTP